MEWHNSWIAFKEIVDAYNLTTSIKEIEYTGCYCMFVETSTTMFKCTVKKTSPANAEQTDYETNYRIV